MRKQIKTKEMYVRDNAQLLELYNKLSEKDKYLREEFTKVLEGRSFDVRSIYENIRLQKILSWEAIFFHIGELKSDAEYSCLLERWRTCRAELDAIKEAGVKKGESR